MDRRRRSQLKVAKNFDAETTIRRNLAHYDPESRRLFIRTPYFFSRVRRHVDAALGPASGRQGIDGHPEIEMALVELYRVTGEERWLRLAAHLLEGRGHGLLGEGRFGPAYCQDHATVRAAPTVAGHAVRQLYLDCGAVDVAVELGDDELLEAVLRRRRDMVATRSYLTGGVGSRHRDEAFGDPFELPPDRAYAETCAAIASVSSTRIGRSQIRTSSVEKNGCGRTSHQMRLALSMQLVRMSSPTSPSKSAQLVNVSGIFVRGNLSKTLQRYDFRPVFMPSQNGELVESARRCGRK